MAQCQQQRVLVDGQRQTAHAHGPRHGVGNGRPDRGQPFVEGDIFFGLGAIIGVERIMHYIRPQALAVTLAAGLALGLLWQLAEPGMRYAKGYRGDRRGPAYTALAAWLDENAAPTDSVAYIRVDTALHLPSP